MSSELEDVAKKISSMEIRGAGKIGRAAALALKDHALSLDENDIEKFLDKLNKAKDTLQSTRPTAVSLANALEAVMAPATGSSVEEIKAGIISAADQFISQSLEAVDKIAMLCANKIQNSNTIMTHCNSSVAVKSIIKAYNDGKKIKVYSTETRPFGQGYITSQALADAGVEVTLIVDSAVRLFMAETDIVIVGADTIVADGTVYNKIGTSQIALCANEFHVPMFVCAETYKFSKASLKGDKVIIEEREHSEIIAPGKLKNVKLRNPVFDATPPEYITAIITELGEIPPSAASKIMERTE